MGGTFVLLKLMDEFGCHSLVFSSSATVYGSVETMPITEGVPVGAGITNAYGRTKYMLEEILRDYHASKVLEAGDTSSEADWTVAILRYFNPVGAHPSGEIGENPNGIPNNLMPYVAQVAVGRRPHLTVFGGDYPTPDGTGVRDYLHVMDLAQGHLVAISYLANKQHGEFGHRHWIFRPAKAMGKACGHEIAYQIGDRRPGDIATCYADPTFAREELGWSAQLGLDEMCRDLWTWQQKNPNGFED